MTSHSPIPGSLSRDELVPIRSTCTLLYRVPQTCLNLFNLDLAVQGPSSTIRRQVQSCSLWRRYDWPGGGWHSIGMFSCVREFPDRITHDWHRRQFNLFDLFRFCFIEKFENLFEFDLYKSVLTRVSVWNRWHCNALNETSGLLKHHKTIKHLRISE